MTQTEPRLVLHPETGREVHTHAEFLEAIDWVQKRLDPLYRVRRHLREEMAERYPPPELPRRRFRTDAQEKVARCPRCGGQLEVEDREEYQAEVRRLKDELKEARDAGNDSA